MAKKTIKGTLSVKSIKQMQRELERYRQSIVDKNAVFLSRIAQAGIEVIDEKIAESRGDSDKNHNTRFVVRTFDGHSEAKLVCEGVDILFIEFGAGVHYNGPAGSSPHPLGPEFGYTIGSFGEGNGKYDNWGYYDESGALHISHGTEATMPMYHAAETMRQKVIEIAKEVFG